MDIFRESTFGRIVRLVSGGKLFAYSEEADPSYLKKYQLTDPDSLSLPDSLHSDDIKLIRRDGGQEGPTTTDNQENGQEDPTTIDNQENGTDHLLVDWAPNDQQNPRNWSTPKKFFVTFQICFLTTSVYIGSAIYTAGIESIVVDFHISPVKALLGLTLFVLGYALGPMVWVCFFLFFFTALEERKTFPCCLMLIRFFLRRHPCPKCPI